MATSLVCNLQNDNNLEDRISQLPDEALADILSLLDLKEAGRSCVLSKRWRDLWKWTTRLNFHAPQALYTLEHTSSKTIQDNERSKYVTWVNEVLRSHERSTIEEFKVHFNLDASAIDVIDEWVKIMIRKRPERVEIDLTPYVGAESYTLSQECYHHFNSVSNLSNVMNLRSLLLGGVNIDGGLLEYLLSNCPHLEMLSVSMSNHLVNLRVEDPLSLKYLEIRKCRSLERIQLSAPKLETFICIGHVNFLLGSNPLLSKLSIGGQSLGLFESYFSQLESLTLTMVLKDNSDIPHVSELRNLKYLKLVIRASNGQRLSDLTRFVVAAPSLAKISVELNLIKRYRIARCTMLVEEPTIQPHHCLKQIEISGYQEYSYCFYLARDLIRTASNLDKLVIDPSLVRNPWFQDGFREGIDLQKLILLREMDDLMGILPPGAKLVVTCQQVLNSYLWL